MNGVRQRCFICANMNHIMAYRLRTEPTAVIEDHPENFSTYNAVFGPREYAFAIELPSIGNLQLRTVKGTRFSFYHFGASPSLARLGLVLADV